MTYFKLNIPKTNESISGYKKNRKNYLEDINTAYKGLSYIESAWNDPNVNGFVKKIKKDKYDINNYFDYVDSIYEEIETFKENIDNICHKYGYRKNSITLKFDDDDIQNCKKYLNNAMSFLDSSMNQFEESWFKSDFQYKWAVSNLKNEIRTVRYLVSVLLREITNFSDSINKEIKNSKARMKKISDYDLKLKKMDYQWKTTNINEKGIYNEVIDENRYGSVSNIDFKIEDNSSNLSENTSFYSTQSTDINIEVDEKIIGLNNNLNIINNDVNEIKLEESEKITGLNNNLNSFNNSMNEIKLEESERISGLNDNVNTLFNSQNEIELEKSETITGLNNNVNISSINSADINYNNPEEINGLDSNIGSSDVNANNILFETDDSIKISDNNIVNENISNNNINYNVDSTVDVASNIKQVQTNQNNINMNGVVSNNYDLGSGITVGEVNPVNISTNINSNINLDTNIKTIDSISDLRDN